MFFSGWTEQYKLTQGEASRALALDRVVES
jgi:hypothetical protein